MGKQRKGYIGMPRGDPNIEIGIAQMADNAVAKKSSAAKYSHASRRHSPRVPRWLSLSYWPYSSANRTQQASTGSGAIGRRRREVWSRSGNSWISCASAHVCRTAPTGGCSFILVSDRRALLRSRRLCGVELPVALLDTASPGVPGNGDPDMVRANPLACRGDFLLRLACCQAEDLIAEARRREFAGDWSCGRGAAAPTSARWAACA